MKGLTGFHGKLPVAGDFLSRGLPVGFQAFWDGWAARHLAPLLRDGSVWPQGGVRLRLASGGKVAAGVVLPGADRVGRRFPLAAFVIASDLPMPPALDGWCDAAALALRHAQEAGLGPDDLQDALERLAPPICDGQGAKGAGAAMLIWAPGGPPVSCEADNPGAALAAAFAAETTASPGAEPAADPVAEPTAVGPAKTGAERPAEDDPSCSGSSIP